MLFIFRGFLLARRIWVRQPADDDLIGNRFAIAGLTRSSQSALVWRILDDQGTTLGEGPIADAHGTSGLIRDFGRRVALDDGVSLRGADVRLQVVAADAPTAGSVGVALAEVRVTLFSGLRGWRVRAVQSGDTLSKIARDAADNATPNDIFKANRNVLNHPDLIHPGQHLRVPSLA